MALLLQKAFNRLSSTQTVLQASRPFSTCPALLAPKPKKRDPTKKRQKVFITKTGSTTLKSFLPITSSIRHVRMPYTPFLHKGNPVRDLTIAKRGTGGRNDSGHITTRGRAGGHRRRIRMVDFYRLEPGEQEVMRIEYDPGRSSHIALLRNKVTGALSYITATEGLREGSVVQSFRSGFPDRFRSSLDEFAASNASYTLASDDSTTPAAKPKAKAIDLGTLRLLAIHPGNVLPLKYIPIGTTIHNISLSPTGAAILARSAGASARLISHTSPTGKHCQVRMSSGEVRLIGLECFATIGSVGNPDHHLRVLGKAGRARWLGRKPKVRGIAMNPVDHPHGGGRGKSKGNHPVSIWGKGAKGQRTRKPASKSGNKMVVVERNANKKK